MSANTTQHQYTIKEAAALTGLPASTLRYYESIGVITPISRGASSGHRVYDEADLDQVRWVAPVVPPTSTPSREQLFQDFVRATAQTTAIDEISYVDADGREQVLRAKTFRINSIGSGIDRSSLDAVQKTLPGRTP